MPRPSESQPSPIPHRINALSRRDMLLRGGAGFGALGLSYLLGGASASARGDGPTLLPDASAWKRPDGGAKSVIFLFMEGGPSQIDTFDPKPEVNRFAGQPLPSSIKRVILPMGEMESPLLASHRTWSRRGECGMWVSDWLPHIGECADDLVVVRSCISDGLNHVNGVCQMNTGSIRGGRPSLGSWVTYGLGTENENLPSYVVLQDNERATVAGGPRNWGAGFMPAVYQGTKLASGDEPIPDLLPPDGIDDARQRRKLALLDRYNRSHALDRPDQSELDARIASYELAFRMQAEAPEAVDIDSEAEETKRLYGLDREETATFGRNCLLARRLVERGVRFIQLYHGAGSKWDAHTSIEKNHTENCRSMDYPVAGLIKDLKRRGLLDSTLVVWGGEFGRTPMSEKGDGRDHNPYGFTMFMAGAGLQGGRVIGETDDFGLHAIEDRIHVHDLHATILHLMGLDPDRLVFLHKGRPERATLNEGVVADRVVVG
ncbi:DUF1501 domain-containing protein [Tautonia sp. JC769]|uniref:DUF1501 domain-containing protein n=1 Tax=Tautonia sp. JC769 TaxID=3232135 RepID=UPI003457CD74